MYCIKTKLKEKEMVTVGGLTFDGGLSKGSRNLMVYLLQTQLV